MSLLLRRNRCDYLRQNLAVHERERSVNRELMRSATATAVNRKHAFTRYTAAVMSIRKIEGELQLLQTRAVRK
jgi:hypothetical protein